jgi:hypothetical protein
MADKEFPADFAPKPEAASPPDKDKPKGGSSGRQERKPTGRPPGRSNAGSKTVIAIEEGLTDLFSGLALAAQVQGNDVAYVVLTSRGPKVAKAWAELARQNASVRRVLERMMTGGAWGGVILSSISLAMPLAQSYGVLPPGIPNPFQLTGEEWAEAAQMQTMRQQYEAQFAAAAAGNGNGDGTSN